MISYDRRSQALAALLAALAGYVDATGFLTTGGFFVSFMSGNSTKLGIGLAQGTEAAAIAGGLIASFLGGVITGAAAGHVAGARWRGPVVLGLVAVLLAGAALLARQGVTPVALVCMGLAMGVENNTFERRGEVSIGVTYMTGSLVKLGQRIATALLGVGDRFGWLPYLLLWLSFVAGVALGAVLYSKAGLAGLWGAAALAGGLTVEAARIGAVASIWERG